MENQSHAFVAGLFVILLGLGMIGAAVWFENPREPARLAIDLISTHSVAGLKVDAPVSFRGVEVGRVRSIAFDSQQAGRIRVRIAVDRAAPVTHATYAKLSYQGINGVALIQLDDYQDKTHEPFSAGTIPEIELQAGLLERAETDIREVLLKAGRVASRVEVLLNEQNTQRVTALLNTLTQTSERYGTLARDLEPSAKALPILLQQSTRTVERAQATADSLARLAKDTDSKLAVLDSTGTAATRVGRAVEDLNRDTLPRLNVLLDELSSDARELKRTLHQANRQPQSFIFGLQPPTPGPGEPGFVATQESGK
ncbi:MAG: MCE family protein [Sinobacteraceae bacterium]|nr:MCE family protein [Nevskiaceae bacterium]